MVKLIRLVAALTVLLLAGCTVNSVPDVDLESHDPEVRIKEAEESPPETVWFDEDNRITKFVFHEEIKFLDRYAEGQSSMHVYYNDSWRINESKAVLNLAVEGWEQPVPVLVFFDYGTSAFIKVFNEVLSDEERLRARSRFPGYDIVDLSIGNHIVNRIDLSDLESELVMDGEPIVKKNDKIARLYQVGFTPEEAYLMLHPPSKPGRSTQQVGWNFDCKVQDVTFRDKGRVQDLIEDQLKSDTGINLAVVQLELHPLKSTTEEPCGFNG